MKVMGVYWSMFPTFMHIHFYCEMLENRALKTGQVGMSVRCLLSASDAHTTPALPVTTPADLAGRAGWSAG